MINIVAAFDNAGLMGVDGKLPWNCPAELKHFKELTTGHVVIMGRKTLESLNGKRLPERINMCLTRNAENNHLSEIVFKQTLPEALFWCEEFYPEKKIFVVGGAELIKTALPLVRTMYLSRIRGFFKPTPGQHELTYFPEYDHSKWDEDEVKFYDDFNVTVLKRRELDWR